MMKPHSLLLAFLIGTASAVPPSVVQITADPGVSVDVTRRVGNTSKKLFITVNQQDVVTVQPPAPPPVDHSAMGPVIDMTKIPAPAIGFAEARVRQAGDDPSEQPRPDSIGAFRIPCEFSHMAKDDPIVYPNQPGKSHLHVFFGNTGASAFSTPESIANTGNSTCAGGILNRTAYWMPAMIDMRDGVPLVPRAGIMYYKTGYNGIAPSAVQVLPNGLRLISGDAKNADPATAIGQFICISGSDVSRAQASIPACPVGGVVEMSVDFAQCWDGVNLDSPNHNAHVRKTEQYQDDDGPFKSRCPASHPVALPVITINAQYEVKAGSDSTRWRLASDAYDAALPGGYSAHADWYMGWDATTKQTWTDNCMNRSLDCHGYLLGDGRTLY